jgi:hypothetical protein
MKQHVSATAVSQLMLFKETIAVYFENQSKRVKTMWVQTVELCNVKAFGTSSNRCA